MRGFKADLRHSKKGWCEPVMASQIFDST